MTRLLPLLLAALALNACEPHEAADLPEEFRERGEHGAKKEAVSDHGPAPAANTPPVPH